MASQCSSYIGKIHIQRKHQVEVRSKERWIVTMCGYLEYVVYACGGEIKQIDSTADWSQTKQRNKVRGEKG